MLRLVPVGARPTPICPIAFEPQHWKAPLSKRAQLKLDPETICMTVRPAGKSAVAGAGAAAGVVAPPTDIVSTRPSWPLPLLPQQMMLPAVLAQTASVPTEMF